jgi:inosine-uridine nucleoside N-ribohydrolase
VGFLTNIAALLRSPADEHSSLSGDELVHKKAAKLVCMAGRFPSGSEFNVKEDASASKYVFENFRKPIVFSGFEIGQQIKTGLPLVNSHIVNSPVKDVFRISIPMAQEDSAGRMSWDQTAVLAAVKGIEPFYKTQPGSITVDENGTNSWKNDDGNHSYLILAKPASDVQKVINDLMLHEPSK